ncbi:MAG: hypothetical protein Q8936_14295 [Bacillota bacterium]|nr:hypothetical protein [Bacillota bacterium]
MNTRGFNTQFGAGLSNLFGGLFSDASAPYKKATNEYEDYLNRAQQPQNPFFNAGKQALPQYQDWLKKMQNPSGFINNLMGQYQESPSAHFQQQQGIRAAQNLGSASGLTGSTPLQMQAQQNAQNISSGDMNQWLQNVLGINTQYGAGQQGLVNQGQSAANILSQLLSNAGGDLAGLAYGREQGKQQNQGNIISGLMGLFGL